MAARDDILKALDTSGGWKIQQTADKTVLTASWRRRLVGILFDEQGRVVKAVLRHPLPFNAGIRKETLNGIGKRQAVLAFIRGEKSND